MNVEVDKEKPTPVTVDRQATILKTLDVVATMLIKMKKGYQGELTFDDSISTIKMLYEMQVMLYDSIYGK